MNRTAADKALLRIYASGCACFYPTAAFRREPDALTAMPSRDMIEKKQKSERECNMTKEVSQTVINALRLLECFTREEELGITELAAEIGAGKAVAARLVGSLTEFGYLRQNPKTRKYRLGLRLMYWGELVKERSELVQVAEPYLRELSQEFQLTTHLAILEHHSPLIVCKVAMGPIVYMDSRVGSTLPTHACATGKCLLAFEHQRVLAEFLNSRPLVQLTQHTITEPDAFLREIELIRQRGYAVDDEESNEGLSCMAVPLLNGDGRAVAAVSISGQSPAVQKNQRDILQRLRETQQKISIFL